MKETIFGEKYFFVSLFRGVMLSIPSAEEDRDQNNLMCTSTINSSVHICRMITVKIQKLLAKTSDVTHDEVINKANKQEYFHWLTGKLGQDHTNTWA